MVIDFVEKVGIDLISEIAKLDLRWGDKVVELYYSRKIGKDIWVE